MQSSGQHAESVHGKYFDTNALLFSNFHFVPQLYASVLMKESVTICKAKTFLEKAVEMQDISGPVYLPAVYMLVEIYDLEMAPEMAYHLLMKYVESCPTSRLHQLLGDVLARMGKEDKAFDHYNIALKYVRTFYLINGNDNRILSVWIRTINARTKACKRSAGPTVAIRRRSTKAGFI